MVNANAGQSPVSTPRSEFFAGARDIFPLIVGAVPFGIIFGTLATTNGLSAIGTLAMSVFVFAGASQFIAAGMIATKTGWLLSVALVAHPLPHKLGLVTAAIAAACGAERDYGARSTVE